MLLRKLMQKRKFRICLIFYIFKGVPQRGLPYMSYVFRPKNNLYCFYAIVLEKIMSSDKKE